VTFHRDFHMLYAHESTYTCAVESLCIPCLYKIFPDGGAFGITLPPNQRPEMCKRSSLTEHTQIEGLYTKGEGGQSSREVLTIGDGDFSFSLSLAKSLKIDNFVATSYESEESVLSVYKHSAHNIQNLRQLGIEVRHVVDGKNIQESMNESSLKNSFDFIIWNFPCIRITGGADAQVADIEENKDLVRSFFSSARHFLKKESSSSSSGEIHVTHKTFEPFCWWDILTLAADAGLVYGGSMVFDRYLYPGYVNRKALDNKSFPFIDAQVIKLRDYIFMVSIFCLLFTHME
jgi:25S rRNA (uracil2634-N3)-methyltransferase